MNVDMAAYSGHRLVVECKNELATLERLLRVVRFRGFSVVHFSADVDDSLQKLFINMTVNSDRPIHLLENQLRKNYEVISVLLLPELNEQAVQNGVVELTAEQSV